MPETQIVAYRENNDGQRLAAGGTLVHELWVRCPDCKQWQVLTRWHDGGFAQGASIACNFEGCDCEDMLAVEVEVPEDAEAT